MKINIKDRKTLTLGLCLILVCVFTLTVAYSALSAVLTISGNARVSAADWDIYLSNPRVTSGSTTTNVPEIKTSSTLEFETTLNMPGDFYEFVVDVVNVGDIDAMIENVVKTPDLTAEQAKFLKYEVSYQNGESITTKQLLAKDTTMPIKVRVEYRKDLNNTDLPTGQVVLDLSLTLEYVQSDGTGSSVTNNGFYISPINVVTGNGMTKGNEVCIDEECFYVISSDSNTVTLFAKYNLYVGNMYDPTNGVIPLENPSGVQSVAAKGALSGISESNPSIGVVPFSNTNYWSSLVSSFPSYIYDENSLIFEYLNNYKLYLETLKLSLNEIRLISYDELKSLGCNMTYTGVSCYSYTWLYSSSYWSGSAASSVSVYNVSTTNSPMRNGDYNTDALYGVRPVIVISKDYFN